MSVCLYAALAGHETMADCKQACLHAQQRDLLHVHHAKSDQKRKMRREVRRRTEDGCALDDRGARHPLTLRHVVQLERGAGDCGARTVLNPSALEAHAHRGHHVASVDDEAAALPAENDMLPGVPL